MEEKDKFGYCDPTVDMETLHRHNFQGTNKKL